MNVTHLGVNADTCRRRADSVRQFNVGRVFVHSDPPGSLIKLRTSTGKNMG